MATRQQAECWGKEFGHCPHVVGTLESQHGPHAPQRSAREVVFRCCHCGDHRIGGSADVIAPERITFAPGCEPVAPREALADDGRVP